VPLTKNSTNKLRREGEKLACYFLPPHKTQRTLSQSSSSSSSYLSPKRKRERAREIPAFTLNFLGSHALSNGM
jgi:hypothetical protein